jgi:hypothetical protein
MKKICPVLLGLVPILSACSSRIDIPGAPPVDRIEVTHNMDTLSTITDPKEIAAIISFLRSRDTGWHGAIGTFPTPMYNVTFESSGAFRYVVWISVPSGNWIGFRADGKSASDNVLREITPKEWSDLVGMLHIPTMTTSTAPAATSSK